MAALPAALPKSQCETLGDAMRVVITVAAMAWAGISFAQQPSLEELQKRLDAARQAQQQRDAAQKADAARRAADQRMEESRSGTLVIRSDAACRLSVNGKPIQTLEAQSAQTIRVPGGQQLVECTSTEDSAVKYSGVHAVNIGSQAVLDMKVADQVNERRRSRNAAAQRAAQEDATCQGNQAMMLEQRGSGVLRQCVTGLEWMQSDNGSNINWREATQYCQSRGGGWRLPQVSELQGIYDGSGALRTRCGSGDTCKISPSFRLTGPYAWSSEQERSSQAWYIVSFFSGWRHSYDVGSDGTRALCVRRP